MPLWNAAASSLPHAQQFSISFLRHGASPQEDPPHENGFSSAMADLDSCELPTHVAQHHGRLLRLGFLHSLPSAFHWNCLMRAYLRLSLPSSTLRLYLLMRRHGAHPDRYTLPIAFKAACLLFATSLGRNLHCCSIKRGLALNEFSESGVISVYCKIGDFSSALKVFDENSQRKLGSWNAVISGFSRSGRASEAIDVFLRLRKEGILPDDVTMVSVASACGVLGDLDLARQVHKCVVQAKVRKEQSSAPLLLQNSVIDMYGKCGRPDLAGAVFFKMRHRDVSSWTSMIMALGLHGRAREAVDLFVEMISTNCGARPNHVTFVAVLTACAHGGMVDRGMEFFDRMAEFGVEPGAAHYGCVVDMLGRVGRVVDARNLIDGMPTAENLVVLGTLLGACEKHGHVEVAEWAAAKLAALEPESDGAYVVLSNIYAANGLWDEVARLRRMMRDKSLAKVPAYSVASLPI